MLAELLRNSRILLQILNSAAFFKNSLVTFIYTSLPLGCTALSETNSLGLLNCRSLLSCIYYRLSPSFHLHLPKILSSIFQPFLLGLPILLLPSGLLLKIFLSSFPRSVLTLSYILLFFVSVTISKSVYTDSNF